MREVNEETIVTSAFSLHMPISDLHTGQCACTYKYTLASSDITYISTCI